ncbi:oligosaccharide flippase family protein [Klebsiella sp. RHBSTW-00484]|uniref:oligosaccharide flippase family protein n=1 Tax=unclassified Klebsiella TaxID=2608929 RepID=UPI0015E4AA9A|nr:MULTISPECIES: oligosaccharide flippase family protein [unclassified Klebsiella]QLO36251.1 oligosaccharide flippase family protein [Klebsiella sp. RHBSTW-00484]QLT75768.1 oligosaccharide flippase family protein [Klebsiella sp. RHBSTW-00464]
MSKNKLIVKNTIYLATRTVVSIAISLYTTRVVLNQLGTNDYGLFSVIYGVVGFAIFLSSAMNESVQRYISIGLGRGDEKNVKDTMINSILIYIIAALLFLIVLIPLKNYVVLSLINIPVTAISVAGKLYLVAVLSIAITIIQSPFNALVIANEKMSFYAYMSIFDVFSKLVIAFSISIIANDKLFIYSLLLLLSSSLMLIIYVIYCIFYFRRYLFGGKVSFSVFKNIASFSFWNIFGNFAYVCRTQGVNIAMNVFFSTAINASYAISASVLNAMSSLTQSLAIAIRPQIFKSYVSTENNNRFFLLILFGSKYTFALLFFLACPIIICAKEVLTIWLTNVPDNTVIFVRLILAVALVDSLSSSIIAGIQASGKIKTYQLVVGFMVFLSLPLTYVFYKFGYQPYSAFVILFIISIINLNLRIYFLKKNINFSFKKYYLCVVLPCFFSAILILASNYILMKVFIGEGLVFFMLKLIFHYILTLLLLVLLITSMDEKKFVFNYLVRFFK